jgi:hypothetical protein
MRTTLARGPKQVSSRSRVQSVGKAERVVAATLRHWPPRDWPAWLIFSNIIHASIDTAWRTCKFKHFLISCTILLFMILNFTLEIIQRPPTCAVPSITPIDTWGWHRSVILSHLLRMAISTIGMIPACIPSLRSVAAVFFLEHFLPSSMSLGY